MNEKELETAAPMTPGPIPGLVVGRHVFFQINQATRAAVICHIWDVTTGYVNLTVFDPDGTTHGETSVYPQFSPGPDPDPWLERRWRWMFEQQPTALTEKHNT